MYALPSRGAPRLSAGYSATGVNAPITGTVVGGATGNAAAIRTPVTHSAGTITALATALRTEAKLLSDLDQIMERQREAVAANDLEAIDDSVFATHRVLVTLGEARKHRRALNHLLGEGDDLSIPALEDFFGGEIPPEVESAALDLADAARNLQKDVQVNRRVLRTAIEAGDEQVRAMCGAPTARTVGYSPRERSPARPAINSAILDRKV